MLGEIGFAELETVAQDLERGAVGFDPVGVFAGILPEAVQKQLAEVVGRDDARALRLDAPVPDPHGIRLVHQFADEGKMEARGPECLDPAVRGDHDAGVLHRVVKVVLLIHLLTIAATPQAAIPLIFSTTV